MSWWLALAGCPWIGIDDLDRRYDPDHDGVLWPDDCDDGDPDAAVPWEAWRDRDGDGLGDPAQAGGPCAAALPGGWADNPDDCDDADPGLPELRWTDADGDGYGDPDTPLTTCDLVSTAPPSDPDCDDQAEDAFPGNPEVCNDGLDNDCDGGVGGCRWSGEIGPAAARVALVASGAPGFGVSAAVGQLLGAPEADLAVASADRVPPAVAVYAGPLDATGTVDAFATATAVIEGPADSLFGLALAATPSGLAVGAPGDASGAGSMRVYDDPRSGVARTTLLGDDTYGNLGWDLASAGDVDGDGQSDLALAEPGSARVYVWRGPLVAGTLTTSDPRFDPSLVLEPGPYTGYAAAGFALDAGDTTGDGVADLVIGDYQTLGGALFVVPADEVGVQALSDWPTATLGGYSSLGWAVAAAGDLDGDGIGDALGGAPGAVVDGYATGGAVVRSGASGALSVLGGGPVASGWGYRVAGPGDLDGDGFADLVVECIASTSGDGWADVFWGRPTLDGLGAEDADARFTELAQTWIVGQSAAGDLDGDGAPDLVLGATAADTARIYGGLRW